MDFEAARQKGSVMSDEEINRKFEVVANHLATLAVGLQQLTAKVDRNADGIASLLAIAELHEREIKETDERLNALINTVERHISEGHNGHGSS
jgi:hypothetical protein